MVTGRNTRLVAVACLLLSLTLAGGCAAGPEVETDPGSEDRRITEEVHRILTDEEDIVAADIAVRTTDGVVVLSGVQSELAPISDVLRRVARIRGVAEVVNQIRILRSSAAATERVAAT
jgi:osmotically-inducible protein OsmY